MSSDIDEIQRVLFVAPRVHIYAIPPLSSSTGHKAATWNVDSEKSRIFTARVRIIETALLKDDSEVVRTDVRLEDPRTGDLFANCPYDNPQCVEQVVDSSRFFAVRVVDGPRKAVLGIGFEDRSDAFDFGVALQEVRRQNHMDEGGSGGDKGGAAKKGAVPAQSPFAEKNDYSLKEGETISITIGNKGRRRPSSNNSDTSNSGAVPMPFLPPPPSAEDVKRKNKQEFVSNGFDDDAFGDFV